MFKRKRNFRAVVLAEKDVDHPQCNSRQYWGYVIKDGELSPLMTWSEHQNGGARFLLEVTVTPPERTAPPKDSSLFVEVYAMNFKEGRYRHADDIPDRDVDMVFKEEFNTPDAKERAEQRAQWSS